VNLQQTSAGDEVDDEGRLELLRNGKSGDGGDKRDARRDTSSSLIRARMDNV
jgi:hypothetical protein